jgi:hypothetical protein
MATDIERIVQTLLEFHDFSGRTVLAVGAGGGQLVDYGRPARRVIAVDKDEAAVERLVEAVRQRGLADKFAAVHSDFLALPPRAGVDVVLFEFCLHEMPLPGRALEHARLFARDVVVIDHAPESPWSWFAGEDGDVERCWTAVGAFPIAKRHDVPAFQRFRDFAELEARLAEQGPLSRARIGALRGQEPIVIPMPYRLLLLKL